MHSIGNVLRNGATGGLGRARGASGESGSIFIVVSGPVQLRRQIKSRSHIDLILFLSAWLGSIGLRQRGEERRALLGSAARR